MGDYLAVNVIQEASSVFPTVDVADCVFISVVAADKYQSAAIAGFARALAADLARRVEFARAE